MSSSNDQPVEYLPDLPANDGRVDPPELPEGYTKPRGYGNDGEIGEALGKVLYEIWRGIMDGVSKDDQV